MLSEGLLESLFRMSLEPGRVGETWGSGRRAFWSQALRRVLAAEAMHIVAVAIGWARAGWVRREEPLHFMRSESMSTSPLCGRLAIFYIPVRKN